MGQEEPVPSRRALLQGLLSSFQEKLGSLEGDLHKLAHISAGLQRDIIEYTREWERYWLDGNEEVTNGVWKTITKLQLIFSTADRLTLAKWNDMLLSAEAEVDSVLKEEKKSMHEINERIDNLVPQITAKTEGIHLLTQYLGRIFKLVRGARAALDQVSIVIVDILSTQRALEHVHTSFPI